MVLDWAFNLSLVPFLIYCRQGFQRFCLGLELKIRATRRVAISKRSNIGIKPKDIKEKTLQVLILINMKR